VGIVISLNLLLIPTYGMTGAAISTMIAWSSINIIRTLFIWIKFKMQPFTKHNLKVFILLFLLYIIAFIIKEQIISFIPLINLTVMMIFITTIYWLIILKTKISIDINNKFLKIITIIKQKLNI
jgi:O-antigen/teichoic acid export membrane protein